MKEYVTIGAAEYTHENVIDKSRFIASAIHVDTVEQAVAFVELKRKRYYDATHNCYAYIVGDKAKFSDDSEPQGTAGMPMLEVLRANDLRETAVVVTRYFGGIKLGAGGLVRAYSGCVAENIAAAKKVLYQTCAESDYAVDYPEVDAALRFFGKEDCNVIATDYSDKVIFKVAVKKEREANFNAALNDFLNGKVTIEKKREYFFPFEV